MGKLIMMQTTKFILIKNNITTSTRDINAVKELRKLGWKVKVSNFGEMI